MNSSLTKKQYGQLINLLQHFQLSNAENTNSKEQMTSEIVNLVGITTCCNSSIDFSKLSYGCFKTRIDLWILDSGATHHITFNKNHLSDIITLPYPLLVRLPNRYKVKVTEVGNVKVTTMIILYKVLFIPSFKYNLISVSSLTTHHKYIASFSDSSCIL